MLTSVAEVPDFLTPAARAAARRSVGPFQWLLLKPWVGLMVKITLGVVVAFTAPWMIPFLPLIDRCIDWLGDELTPAQRANVRQFCALYRQAALTIDPVILRAVANPEPE